jgi:S-adenosylmethionine-dependent methyltransferase
VPDPLLWDAVLDLLPAGPVDVLDLGGGTGGLAVPVAALGHRVTVVDPSPDALAALARRAAESGVEDQVRALQGDADDLQVEGFDVVLCHGVLERVDDPAQALAGVARALRPAGRLSLLLAQRSAAVVAAALSGHLARAQALLDDPAGRWGEHDSLTRRFDRAGVVDLVTGSGLAVVDVQGLRPLGDLVSGQLLESDPTAPDRLRELDRRLAAGPEYAGLSAALHVLARRPG